MRRQPARLVISIASAIPIFTSVLFGQAPPGFEVTTFARPPQVTYPTGLAVAPTGEVYVSVDLNSSLDRKQGRGKVVRCVDTDGDGVADRFTDFVPTVDSPRGSCFVGGTLYLVHPPYLSAFRDRDGDGVAEQHDVLVERLGFGLNRRGADHTSNGVRMGIDGWLYLAIGDYGMIGAKGTDGSTLQLDGGGVVRVRPDGSELELYCANTRNIVDVAVSPRLDVFARDNTNDGKGWNTRFHHLIQLADMGYPRLYKNFADEHLPSLADYGGGSGTAAYYLDEPGIPAPFNDRVYTGDFTTKKVYVHPMRAAGATFITGQEVFFATQAIDMDVDGRSRIFVCDWKGGGYRYGKAAVGSVTLITATGAAQPLFPDLRKVTDGDLLDHVASVSAVRRINAQAEILRRGRKDVFSRGLAARANDEERGLHGRIAALFTLGQLDGAGATERLVEIATAAGGELREFALRAMTDRRGALDGVPADLLVGSLRSTDQRVVLQAITCLARLGDVRHAPAILPLAVPPPATATPAARAVPHVAVKALVRLRADRACLAALDDPKLRPAGLRVLKEIHTMVAVEGLASRIGQASSPGVRDELFGVLCRLYHVDQKRTGWKWWGTRPDDRGPYFTPVAWSGTPSVRRAIEETLARLSVEEQRSAYLKLVRNRIDPRQLALDGIGFDEVRIILDGSTVEAWAIPKLAAAARDRGRDLESRLRAFQALRKVDGRHAIDAQFAVAAAWHASELDNLVIQSAFEEFLYSTRLLAQHRVLDSNRLARGPEARVRAMVLLNLVRSPLAPKAAKTQLDKLVRKHLKNPALVYAIGEMEQAAYRAEVEQAASGGDRRLVEVAQAALAKLDAAKTRSAAAGTRRFAGMRYREALPILMKSQGDPKLGRQVFARAACLSCHALSQKEPQRGPYLGAVGGKFDRRYLIQSIFDPGAIIAQGFQTRWFETKDGEMHAGFVTDDADGVVELRDITGAVTRLQKSEVVDQGAHKQSMMPPGLAAGLTVREVASLLDYLQSLR